MHQAKTAAPHGPLALPTPTDQPLEWRIDDGLTPYPDAVATMEARVAAIRAGTAPEMVWLLQHPPLYTAGTSARAEDLLSRELPVFRSGRGGQYTYHGPGQRVAYAMLDLRRRMQGRIDVRHFVWLLEEWVIRALAQFNILGERRPGRIGIWVDLPRHGQGTAGQEAKIAAIGVRLRQGVCYHGVSVNLDPELRHFAGIVPCGIREHGVTSIQALGQAVTMPELDMALRTAFTDVFEDAASAFPGPQA